MAAFYCPFWAIQRPELQGEVTRTYCLMVFNCIEMASFAINWPDVKLDRLIAKLELVNSASKNGTAD